MVPYFYIRNSPTSTNCAYLEILVWFRFKGMRLRLEFDSPRTFLTRAIHEVAVELAS